MTTTPTLTADYLVVRDSASGDEAVYKIVRGDGPLDQTGTLVHRGNGTVDEFVAGLETTGAKVEYAPEPRPHTGVLFPDTLDLTPPQTAETALIQKIADLREQAKREDDNDALGGGWGNAGNATRAKAEAVEEALEIVRRFR